MIKTNITVESKAAKEMYLSILPDMEKKGRSEVKVTLKDKKLICNINSPDPTSARAAFNSFILKVRTMLELNKGE